MEESKLKAQKLNQLSRPHILAKRNSIDSNDSDDHLAFGNLKNGLRSSNKNQHAPKIYTNNISNIPRFTGLLDKRPSATNKTITKKTSDAEVPCLESEESLEFKSFLAKRISNTSLTRHTSLLDKTGRLPHSQFKSSIISMPPPPPPTSNESFDYLREDAGLTHGFKIYSNSQNNLKLTDSDDNSLVELVDVEDSNDARQISSPVSRKLSQKSNLSCSSSASSNEASSSKRDSVDSNSSPTLRDHTLLPTHQTHKSKSSFSSLSSKKFTSPTSSFSSSNLDTKSNKQGIAYINIDSFSCPTSTSLSAACENEKSTNGDDLRVNAQDSKLNCINNINNKLTKLINYVGDEFKESREKSYQELEKNEVYDDISKCSVSESQSYLVIFIYCYLSLIHFYLLLSYPPKNLNNLDTQSLTLILSLI